jgi:hypothetical protein
MTCRAGPDIHGKVGCCRFPQRFLGLVFVASIPQMPFEE